MNDHPSLADRQRSSFARASRSTRASWPEEDSLCAEELEVFLASSRYAVLATTRPTGRPHAVMVAFLWRDDRFWLPSVGGSIRLRNLAHRPEASLVVAAGEGEDHVAVIVEGRCRVHLDIATVLDGSFRARWRERFETAAEWAEAVIELTPDKVLSHGRGRIRPEEP
jgi:general stress protein 26